MNVTLVPAQIAPLGLAAMLTLAGRFGFTVTSSDPVRPPEFAEQLASVNERIP